MTTLLEALYILTSVSALVTLVLLWRERRTPRPAAVRLGARHWAGITIALAVVCVVLYLL